MFVVFFGQCQEDGWDTSGSHVCFLLRQQIAGLDGRSDSRSPDIQVETFRVRQSWNVSVSDDRVISNSLLCFTKVAYSLDSATMISPSLVADNSIGVRLCLVEISAVTGFL